MTSRRSEDMGTSTTHVTQGLAQRCADRPATYAEGVGDLLLGGPQVGGGDDDRALAPRQKTQELAQREPIEQCLGRRRNLRLAKRTDKLVEPEGQAEPPDASSAPEGDTKQPAGERVIAWRRSAQTLDERFLQRVAGKLPVQQDRDERAVQAGVEAAEGPFPRGRRLVVVADHLILYATGPRWCLVARRIATPGAPAGRGRHRERAGRGHRGST